MIGKTSSQIDVESIRTLPSDHQDIIEKASLPESFRSSLRRLPRSPSPFHANLFFSPRIEFSSFRLWRALLQCLASYPVICCLKICCLKIRCIAISSSSLPRLCLSLSFFFSPPAEAPVTPQSRSPQPSPPPARPASAPPPPSRLRFPRPRIRTQSTPPTSR